MFVRGSRTMLKKYGKKILVLCIILAGVLFLALFSEKLFTLVKNVDSLKNWLDRFGSLQYLVFILLVAVQVIVAVIPGGPYQIAGGLLYGTFLGSVLCVIGCSLGSMFVFLMVRRYGMRVIRIFISKEALEKTKFIIESKQSRRLIAVCFIIPGTPKDAISYVAGLTNISFFHWMLICSIGRMPGILLSVFAGHAFHENQYSYAIFAFILLAVICVCGAWGYKKISSK